MHYYCMRNKRKAILTNVDIVNAVSLTTISTRAVYSHQFCSCFAKGLHLASEEERESNSIHDTLNPPHHHPISLFIVPS